MTESTPGTGLESLQIVLTGTCNLNCSYCYQHDRRGGAMPWNVLQAALDLVVEGGCHRPAVTFQGGEPLLEFDLLIRAIEYLERNSPPGTNPDYYLVTNGMLLDDSMTDALVTHRVTTGLSFDGVRAAQDLRCPGTFDTLESLLNHLRTSHSTFFSECLTVSVTVRSGNLGYLAESVAALLDLGVASIALNPLMTHDEGWRPELIKDLEEQFVRLDEMSRVHLARTGSVPLLVFRRGRRESSVAGAPDFRCAAADGGRVAVDTDGRIYPCVVLAGSYQSLPAGLLASCVEDIAGMDVFEAASTRRFVEFADFVRRSPLFGSKNARSSSYGTCRECRFLGSCCVCPASLGHMPTDAGALDIPDIQCAFNRVSLEFRKGFPRPPDIFDVLQGLVKSVV